MSQLSERCVLLVVNDDDCRKTELIIWMRMTRLESSLNAAQVRQ